MVKKMSKKEKKIERELLWIVGFFVFLVVLFIVARTLFNASETINYEGLTFVKEKVGELNFYKYSYYVEEENGGFYTYNLYVRKDPRNNNVPISKKNTILFDSPITYVTIDTSYLNQCAESAAAVGSLAKFLSDNQIKVKSANMDFTEAAVHQQEWVTCESKPNNDVVQIMKGNETRIDITHNCYTITIGEDCEALKAVERFQLESILDNFI